MRKLIKQMILCLFLATFVWCGSILADRRVLNENVIRMHVVANSDSSEDQEIKLKIRDAVMTGLKADLERISDTAAARKYLREALSDIEKIANRVLHEAGFEEDAVATLCRESFETRAYDTFSLPAGTYDSLRITIGEGTGRNWWCVVFPTLCIPTASGDFADIAVDAGFSDSLTSTLKKGEHYQLRFYCLEALGKLENILFAG